MLCTNINDFFIESILRRSVVKPPWNTGPNAGSEDMPRKGLTIFLRVWYDKYMKHFLRCNGMYAIYAYYYRRYNASFCHTPRA